MIGRVGDGGVGFPRRILQVLEGFGEFLRGLFRVVRDIQGEIKKEGFVLVLFYKGKRPLGHELGKVLAGGLDRGGPLVQVVKTRAVEKVVVVVVDEPVPDSEKLIEALLFRSVVPMGSKCHLPKSAVRYPALFKTSAMVTSSKAMLIPLAEFMSPCVQWFTPLR